MKADAGRLVIPKIVELQALQLHAFRDAPGILQECDLVSGVKLLAAHRADLAVNADFTLLNKGLGHAARFNGVGEFQKILQFDKLGMNRDLNRRVRKLFCDSDLHLIPPLSAGPAEPCSCTAQIRHKDS